MIQHSAKIDGKAYPLSYGLFKTIKNKCEVRYDDFYGIYKRLFLLTTIDELEVSLEIVYDDFKECYNTENSDWWFTAFHKSLRQADFFQGFYKEVEIELISKEENKKLKIFKSKIASGAVDKDKVTRDENGMFTKEYREILNISERKNHQKREVSISGCLDMILYDTIHVDKKGVLYEILKDLMMVTLGNEKINEHNKTR